MDLSRQILRNVDDRLRSELDQEKGEWMVKVPVSGATRDVWRRYCETVGVHMGEGLALLLHQELASIADVDLEAIRERFIKREADLEARTAELSGREQEVEHREREVEIKERMLASREQRLNVMEQALKTRRKDLELMASRSSSSGATVRATRKLGRNERCWCESGKKYKNCHLPMDD